MLTELKRGTIRQGAIVNLAAALVANAVAVYQVSNFNQQLGTKSFKAIKAIVQNVAAGNCWLSFGTGTGGAFAATVPVQRSLNNLTEEFDLNGVEHFADMTAWVDALAAGGSLNIQIVVEEIG